MPIKKKSFPNSIIKKAIKNVHAIYLLLSFDLLEARDLSMMLFLLLITFLMLMAMLIWKVLSSTMNVHLCWRSLIVMYFVMCSCMLIWRQFLLLADTLTVLPDDHRLVLFLVFLIHICICQVPVGCLCRIRINMMVIIMHLRINMSHSCYICRGKNEWRKVIDLTS